MVSSCGALKADVMILSSPLSDIGNNWRIWVQEQPDLPFKRITLLA